MAPLKKISLSLYNTETKRKETIKSSNPEKFCLYTCGPTVYDYAHIGNFRTYIVEDLVRRTLRYLKFPVFQVMNITDIDDKTIQKALEKNITLQEYTYPYTQAFFEDLDTLQIERAEQYPRATHFIPQMIAMIEKLISEDKAYLKDGNVFFAIRKFPEYGRLSHLNMSDLKGGASGRIDRDEYSKESISDFVLWKAYDPERDGNIFWESPFGPGRPGWHIECSAMAHALLGKSIDMHMGGVDNIFPHHENEIAQSESCFKTRFVRYWVHVEHLLVEGKKMSKSLGNFYTLRDLLTLGFTGREVRYSLLNAHYRMQYNFSLENLKGSRSALRRIDDFVSRVREIDIEEASYPETSAVIRAMHHGFFDAIMDDLNIPRALAALFDGIRVLHSLCDQLKVGKVDASNILTLFESFHSILGIFSIKDTDEIPADVVHAFEKRNQARLIRDYVTSDQYRDYILSKGYIIEDSKDGSSKLRKSVLRILREALERD